MTIYRSLHLGKPPRRRGIRTERPQQRFGGGESTQEKGGHPRRFPRLTPALSVPPAPWGPIPFIRTKPASRVGGAVVRFGRTIAMPYSAAIPSPPHQAPHRTQKRFAAMQKIPIKQLSCQILNGFSSMRSI